MGMTTLMVWIASVQSHVESDLRGEGVIEPQLQIPGALEFKPASSHKVIRFTVY